MKPLVSVMMPAYNAASFIADAIKSMQAQTYENWQLCIVDDGSTDQTYYVASSFLEDARICLDQIPQSGCPTARNHCLKMMEGDIFARLDADDTHDPERLESQVHLLLEQNTVDIVSSNMTWLVNDLHLGKNTGLMLPPLYMAGKSNGPCCASLVAWRRVYELVGGFDPKLPAGSDGDWNFRAILERMTWGHVDGYYYHQRRHPGQISKRLSTSQRQAHSKAREKYAKLYNKRLP